jgi:hypothetical protein
LLHVRASIHACRTTSWHIAVIKVDGAIYKGILEPLLVEVVNEVSNSFPRYILQASMFNSLEKSFVLSVYAEAMARASPPTRPSCVPRQRNVDPRVLEFFDITATIDASFPVDCSDSESNLCLVESFNGGPRSPGLAVTIVCHNLLSCLLLYFLRDWCHFYIHAVRLPGPLPLIFMMVLLSFGLNNFFWWKSFAS